MSDHYWLVCHTKPRCEKKFAALMGAEKFEHYLALVQSVRRYGTQTKKFTKPLFPGYVFAKVPVEKKARIYQQDLLARAIIVEDEARFLRQLEDVRAIKETKNRIHQLVNTEAANVDRATAAAVPPRFVDKPPLTLDDQLDYKLRKLKGDVPLVAATFDSMTSATTGIALRLDGVPEDQLVYLAVLPALLTVPTGRRR